MNSITRSRSLFRLAKDSKGKIFLLMISCGFFARRMIGLRRALKRSIRLSLQFKGNPFTFYIFNQIDLDTLRSVFVVEDWDISRPLNPKIVFDLGAHIGATAIYFCLKYPNAKIYCFEPIPDNQEHFLLNIKQFSGRVVLIKSIVSSVDGDTVTFYKNKDSNLSSSLYLPTGKTEVINVSSVTLDSIVKKYGITDIDLIKFNIEGAEYDVFDKCACLGHTRYLIGEVHPDLSGKPVTEFKKILSGFKVLREMDGKTSRKFLLLERIS